jgi:hypothetical protein
MRLVSGRCVTANPPVVIAAYQKGEPPSAIPLDQVMLRENERDFALWIPQAADYDLMVFGTRGIKRAVVTQDPDTGRWSVQTDE